MAKPDVPVPLNRGYPFDPLTRARRRIASLERRVDALTRQRDDARALVAATTCELSEALDREAAWIATAESRIAEHSSGPSLIVAARSGPVDLRP
jgi:hypothetical protein